MKKNILKAIACLFLVGLMWSCSTENDVQMQPSESNSQVQLKNGGVLEGVIGIDKGNGNYEITVDETELIAELERLVSSDDTPAKFVTVSIVKKVAVNNPDFDGYVLFAGTGDIGYGSTTLGVNLVQIGSGFYMQNPATGGTRTTCRGCGTGCFLEYYEIDGHFLAYCDSYGCGSNCEKNTRK